MTSDAAEPVSLSEVLAHDPSRNERCVALMVDDRADDRVDIVDAGDTEQGLRCGVVAS